MKRKFFLLTFLVCIGFASFAAEPRIANLTVTPRFPWNGKIDITYSIECDDKESEWAVFFHAHDRNLDRDVEMISLTGDGADELLKAGGPYKVVWDSAADYPEGHSSALSVVVNVGFYMVVDLTTGKHRYSAAAPDLSDDTCRTTELWLRYITAGTFMMGSPEDEVGRFDNETLHQVTLTEDYYIGVFEMTQKQYALVMGGNPSYYKGDCRPVEQVSYNTIRGTGAQAGAGWPAYGHEVDDGSFMAKLRALTGLECDLPTEAQWEYACRAETTTALNTGKNLTSTGSDAAMSEAGRYYYNRSDGKGGYSQHTKVGSYLPNAWGLYDMHGNVLEWCLDWQGDYTGSETDPCGSLSGGSRVLRGGCWYVDFYSPYGHAQRCRSAFRFGSGPANCAAGVNGHGAYNYGDFGFRVCVRP